MVLGQEVTAQIVFFHTSLLEAVIIEQRVLDAGFEEVGHQARFPHALGQPESTHIGVEDCLELLRVLANLPDTVAARQDWQNGLVISPAKDFKLTTLDDLKGKRVSVPKGSTQDIAVSGYGVEGLEVVRFDDDALAMQALTSGQVDATAAVAAVANDVIAKQNLTNLEVKTELPIFTLYWSMAVRHDATELHQWLNNFIYYQEVTGNLGRLHEKWIGPTGVRRSAP